MFRESTFWQNLPKEDSKQQKLKLYKKNCNRYHASVFMITIARD